MKNMTFLLFPGFALTSYSLAVDALLVANQAKGEKLFNIQLVSASSDDTLLVPSSGMAPVKTEKQFSNLDNTGDTLFICAYRHAAAYDHAPTFRKLRKHAADQKRIGCLTSGTLILARAGIIKSGHCTIVDEHKNIFRELYPNIRLQDNLFTVNKNILSCAGGMSALDMLLYMISQDHGLELASQVAEQFLQDRMRSIEETTRRSRYLRLQLKSAVLGSAVEIMENHIENTITIVELADRVGSTVRSLENCFQRHEKLTPNQYYLRLRLQRARKMVEESQLPLNSIALATGFHSHSYFSKRFKQTYSCSPSEMRVLAANNEPVIDAEEKF
ncbi:MAG: helix-turn-helix domain-containing protein [Pseudomonadota bacterium]